MMNRKLFFSGLLLLLTAQISAQVFSNRVFNEEKGLSQKFIFSIAQDKNGVIILGTEKGVVNFNGDQFSFFNTSNGLSEDKVSAVYSDNEGITFVGHFQKGISRITDGVASIVDSSAALEGRVNSFAEDHSGNIWGVSEGKGIFRIDRKGLKAQLIPGNYSGVSSIAFDSYGQLICAGNSGLGIYKVENNGISLQETLPETQDKNVSAICLGKLNGAEVLFAALDGDGIYCYTFRENEYKLMTVIKNELNCRDMNFSSLACTHSGELWIGTMGEGLRKVIFNPAFFPEGVKLYTSANGLVDDNVKSLLVDFENNLWVGTFGHGLLEIPYSVFSFYTRSNGLLKQEVNCVVRDKQGTFWIGNNNGMTRFRKEGDETSEFFDAENGFTSKKVTCLAIDKNGMIWIGTSGDGIFLLDPLKKTFQDISKQEHLESLVINTITVTKDNRIFFGTTDGLYIYSENEKKFSYYTTIDGLMHNNIQQLYTDLDNNVWFSSQGTPPYLMSNEKVTAFKKIDKLKGYNINGVCQDQQHVCWIVTDGDGVFSYDGKKFRQYTAGNGLKSPNCIAAIADNNNSVWVVHKSGLSLKFPDDSMFYSFSSTDNLLFADLNPFVYKDSSNTVYFCSNYGLIEISNQDKSYIRGEPKISLAKLFINGTERMLNREIFLPPGNYNLSFEFNNILYGIPYPLPFYYRIIGADSVWRSATGRTIIIPQLSSGNYVLQVYSSRRQEKNPKNTLQIKINIDRPFWQKNWFLILMIFFVPLFIFMMIRIQTISLRKLNRRLQSLVSEKTSELESEKEAVSRINLELESKNKDITDSIHYAKRIQLAILPDIGVLKEQFPQSFIYYQPRDIVSGDFYWFTNKGSFFIIAAVDCTGHGIPGALMSMIGSTLLNKIVFDYNTLHPAKILQRLNSEVSSLLHQKDLHRNSNDGMDIALCVIDKNKSEMKFAGAGRPVFIVRDNKVSVYKTNKSGIGGVYNTIFPVYHEITIPLQQSDAVYLFSDGCTDQFGGDNRSKFSTRRMNELLKEIAHLSAQEQEHIIEKTFSEWRGEEEQLDDMLFIGFKVE